MTKFLIAGFGSIGRRHFRNLLALGQRDILFYRTGRSSLPDDELNGFIVETDLKKALAHKPDAVIVANHTAAHLSTALQAAEAGCHVLLEKPISHNMAGTHTLEQVFQCAGGKVLVGYQFRFHPVLKRIKALLGEGMLGRPLSARVHWGEYLPAWHPWEDYRDSYSARAEMGGGVVLTLSHPLDYLRWFFGDVQALWAFAGQISPLELAVDDFAEIGMQFANNFHASLHLNYYQRPVEHHFEIVCTEGTLQWDNATAAGRIFQANVGEWLTLPPPDGFERNDLFLDELRHFLDVIEGRTEPICSLADGKAALVLAQAALESARERRIVQIHAEHH